ncbi:MAG: methionine--tRNA ligase subunit beta [Planctomycetota bacterium]
MITFDDFLKVELRTARVVEAKNHENADRLLVVKVDLGEMGERQVVAGIRGHYAPEDLVGRTVVVVANLEPATLRGEESQGMILAVVDGDTVRVLSPDGEVGPGLKVS